jgi:serine/threonine-protein kinase
MTRPFVPVSLLTALACASSSGDGSPSGSSPTPAPSAPASASAYFPPEAVWYRDVSTAPLDAQSAAVIAYLDRVGWGLGRMQIDFSIEVLAADAATPLRPFTPTEDHFSPDCDTEPVPVPPGGALEGEDGYECRGDGDCHLIVAAARA